MTDVLALRNEDAKVIRGVICFDSVLMMNYFSRLKRAAQGLLSNDDVLVDVAIGMSPRMFRDVDTPIPINVTDATLPRGALFSFASMLVTFIDGLAARADARCFMVLRKLPFHLGSPRLACNDTARFLSRCLAPSIPSMSQEKAKMVALYISALREVLKGDVGQLPAATFAESGWVQNHTPYYTPSVLTF